jgi:prepilin-type N-terminal cleavage/methylation domain-containing protein
MNKKAFSLIELIFVIAIISVIVVVVLPNFKSTKDSANFIKIKSDILLIRNALIQYKNKIILSNSSNDLDSLDDGELLFSKILKNPIIPSVSHKSGEWIKQSDDKYTVFIDNENSLEFIYDKSNYTFDCDFSNNYCKELTQ